jgi:hypothetical protein
MSPAMACGLEQRLWDIKAGSNAEVDDDTSTYWPVFDWRLFILLLAVQDYVSAVPAQCDCLPSGQIIVLTNQKRLGLAGNGGAFLLSGPKDHKAHVCNLGATTFSPVPVVFDTRSRGHPGENRPSRRIASERPPFGT